MKQSFFTSKNIPYLVAGLSVILGSIMLGFDYTSTQPATRDPDIGAGLRLLLGYFLIAAGIIGSLVILLVRKSKSPQNK